MQDSSGNTNAHSSRAISRRDAIRYATAASALAGLGAVAATTAAPEASAATSMLIDYAMHQIPAADIKAAGYAGVVNYVSLSRPGSNFGAKPITRPYAEDAARCSASLPSTSIWPNSVLGNSIPLWITADPIPVPKVSRTTTPLWFRPAP